MKIATTKYICDMCKKEVKNLESKININLVFRDFANIACGGHTNTYEICEKCSYKLDEYIKNFNQTQE